MQVLRQAHQGITISDDEAINSYHYQQMLSYYPRFLERKSDQKDSVQQVVSLIMDKPFNEALKEMRAKGQEYWEYTVYEKLLTGKAKEKTLAAFLIKCIDNGELKYQMEGYNKYKAAYPAGGFLASVEKKMKRYLDVVSNSKTDTAGIVIESTGPGLSSLDSILMKHKGKLVYIDLWGTWCGPCRDEFKYIAELKRRFSGKPVDFLYIAKETRPDPELYWRQMIRFYSLSGRHLMMGRTLEEHFQHLYGKGQGLRFPSYLLADKNGKIVSIHFNRPSDREQLYSEIEKYL
jgi:thiol-disulfide isomerase/thioredoxin